MILVLKNGISSEEVETLKNELREKGFIPSVVVGKAMTIMGVIGDTTSLRENLILADDRIDRIVRIQEPYKKVNRLFRNEDTIVDIGGCKIGGGNFAVIAGPCSVEDRDQMVETATAVKKAGADLLRGGAFKPRTSPYSFQGLGVEGLKLLRKAKEATGLPIITELMDPHDFDSVYEYADIIQIGARNMANFALLKEVGKCDKPVLLKRGMSSTIKEFLMSAEYVMSEGNENVILCERGIRTFENHMRNTLDLNIVTAIRELSHLPIIIDPSHATGKASMIEPASRATAAIGAHGLMIEVHNNPHEALCDGAQSLTPEEFKILNDKVRKIHDYVNGGGLC